MKNAIFLLLMAILFSSLSHAQDFWQQTNGPDGGRVLSLAINSSGHIFAGTDSGVYRSTDNGDNWIQINTGLTNTDVHSLAINSSGHIFAGTGGGGVFRSTDNGNNWTQINTGLTNTNVHSLSKDSSGHIFAGTSDGVFRSTDNGNNWTRIWTDISPMWSGVMSLAINSSGHIFAGTGDGGGVFRSTDNGNNWTQINTGLSSVTIFSLAINSSGHIFAGGQGSPGGCDFFRSTDNGDNWTRINTGWTSTQVYALAINSSGHIFAGTGGRYIGVFRSTDNGDNWTLINTGLSNTDVRSLAINSSGYIFAGTEYGGVYRSTQSSIPPAAPSNLAATAVSSTQINLSWTDNSNDEQGFKIERAPGGTTNFAEIATVGANITSYQNTGLSVSTSYSYRVRAYNSSGNSGYSNTDTATTQSIPPAAPSSLVATAASSTQINLSWTDNSNNEQGFSIERAPGGTTNFIEIATVGANITSYQNTGLSASTSYSYRVRAYNSSGNSGYSNTDTAKTTDVTGPDISFTPMTSVEELKEILISASIVDESAVDQVTLYYRRSGARDFSSLTMINNAATYQASIPADSVTSRGIEYFITATDIYSNESRLPAISGYYDLLVRITGSGLTRTCASGDEQNAYRLVSIPLNADNRTPAAIFSNLGSYDNKEWRLFELRADQIYYEYPNIAAVTPGNGYWLIVRDSGKNLKTGAGITYPTSQEYSIPLFQGWTFVANPFNFSIPLSNLHTSNDNALTLRSYQGQWNDPVNAPVVSIEPFAGYAVNVSSTDTLLVNPDLSNLAKVYKPLTEDPSLKSYVWGIHITARCQQAGDIDNYATVRSKSIKEWDRADLVEPPPIGKYVSVYFPHPDWTENAGRYCLDVRPEPQEGEMWDFEVYSNINDKIELSFAGMDQIPASFDIYLVDTQFKIVQDLNKLSRYEIAQAKQENPRQLRLITGQHDFVQGQLLEMQLIPSTYHLSQNFPNPFNPTTTIRYGLPIAGRVTLTVYDVLGREVAILLDRTGQQAGYHNQVWDSRNGIGEKVASGLYIYKIMVNDFIAVKKMILLK